MQSSQNSIPPFWPVSCAEVFFSAVGRDDWCGAATWVAVVGGDTPRLFAALTSRPDGPPSPASNFSVRLPLSDLPDSFIPDNRACSPAAAVHIQCTAGTAKLEHGRFLLCGEVTGLRMEEEAPWLSHLLRVSGVQLLPHRHPH
jgi:hypothetical protein